MNNNITIYALIDPRDENVRYVGKSNNVNSRYSYHINEYKSKQISKKINWIKSLYKIGLKPELLILDEVPVLEWEFWEIHYISLFKFYGYKLTNSTIGGDHSGSSLGIKRSEETKIKMRLAASKRTPEFYLNLVQKRDKNLEWRLKLSNVVYTKERRKRLSDAKQNMSSETKLKMKMNNWLRTPIIRLDNNGCVLKEYESASDAAREITGSSSGASYILKCIRENRLYKQSKWKLA